MPGLHINISFLLLPDLPILRVIPRECSTFTPLLPEQGAKSVHTHSSAAQHQAGRIKS